MKDFDMWVYHKTEAPKIIKHSDLEAHEAEGWKDSPRHFHDLANLGVSKEDAEKTFDQMESLLNGTLNVDEMNRAELDEFALKHFKVDLTKGDDKAKNKAEALDKVKELLATLE